MINILTKSTIITSLHKLMHASIYYIIDSLFQLVLQQGKITDKLYLHREGTILETYLFGQLVMMEKFLIAVLLMDMYRIYMLYQLELQIKMVDQQVMMKCVQLK